MRRSRAPNWVDVGPAGLKRLTNPSMPVSGAAAARHAREREISRGDDSAETNPLLQPLRFERGVNGGDRIRERAFEGQSGRHEMPAAAERGRRKLHVYAAARAQAHPNCAVIVLKERGGLDAFDRAQMLHDFFGV